MRTIAVLNQKGGVGKTTTVTNVAAALAAAGAKVVAIDFDPQAHLTIHFGLEPQKIESGSYKVLTQSAGFDSEILMVRPNLWLLPANIDLVGAESELVSVVGRETILREAMEASIENFDYCLIDCAPSLGLLTLNALAAAEEVLIPLQPHFLALQGFGKLLQTIELVNRRINTDLKVKGVLLCMFDSRASLPNEVKNDIEQFLQNARGTNSAWSEAQMLPTFIRRNIKLAEAPSYGKTIFEYEPNCNGAEDYKKVAEFILAQSRESDPVPEQVEPVESESDYSENVAAEQIQEQSEPQEPQHEEAQPVYIDINQFETSGDENSPDQGDSQDAGQVSELQQSPPEEQIQSAGTDEYNEQPSIETGENQQPDSPPMEEMPELQQSSPEEQIQSAGADGHTEQPPFEIREIPPQESQAPAEFSETPTDQNQNESDRQQY
ncbi:MAG: AAA family ATPase [Sedimentisphaerales bacterium]|nr:AAA family ATPase [Sedimentisphaerales bacterium]